MRFGRRNGRSTGGNAATAPFVPDVHGPQQQQQQQQQQQSNGLSASVKRLGRVSRSVSTPDGALFRPTADPSSSPAVPSASSSHVRRAAGTGPTATPLSNDYEPNPVIPVPPESPNNNPSGPRRKSWEMQMKRFLGKTNVHPVSRVRSDSNSSNNYGNSSNRNAASPDNDNDNDRPRGNSHPVANQPGPSPSPHSPSGTAESSSVSTLSRSTHSSPMRNPSCTHTKPNSRTSAQSPAFAVVPGTTRLLAPATALSAVSKSTQTPVGRTVDSQSDIVKPPSSRTTGIFRNVFSRSTSDHRIRRNTSKASVDELDDVLRKGQSSNSLYQSTSTERLSSRSPKRTPIHPSQQPTQLSSRQTYRNPPADRTDGAVVVTTATENNENDKKGSSSLTATSAHTNNANQPTVIDDSEHNQHIDQLLERATVYTGGGLGMSLSAASLSSAYLNQFTQLQQQHQQQQHHPHPAAHTQAQMHRADSGAFSVGNDSTVSPQHSELGLVLEHSEHSTNGMSSSPASMRFYPYNHYGQTRILSHQGLPHLPQIQRQTSNHVVDNDSEHSIGTSSNNAIHNNDSDNNNNSDNQRTGNARIQETQQDTPSAAHTPSIPVAAVQGQPRTAASTSLLAAQLNMYNSQIQAHMLVEQQQQQQLQLQQQQSRNGRTNAPPEQIIQRSLPSSLGSSLGGTPDSDLKRAFTQFHNMAQFSTDATSPFLGDDPNNNNAFQAMLRGTSAEGAIAFGHGHGYSDRFVAGRPPMSASLPIETVDEHNLSINKAMRLLKPVEGTDKWQSGRRYLIAPAALAASPLSVVSTLAGPGVQTAAQAANDDVPQAFGTIDLGEALMTYVGEKHHLSLGKWSRCRLVLRQNYLLEYDLSTPISAQPRGFAHLECAVAYPHGQFPDMLELSFYASPCAKADQRVLMIRVPKREDRDNWIVCLNDAAQLRVTDMYDYDDSVTFGEGRYATVYPARRKDRKYYQEECSELSEMGLTVHDKSTVLKHCNRALKVVDKRQFWSRVVKGRERSDTLVREVSVQATLTARGRQRHNQAFLRILGIFETSDNFVLELELLEGTDLFDYVYRKGTLSEAEAADVMKDVLSCLVVMNRAGLAHRDIKPANILMCDMEATGLNVKVGDFGMSTFVGVDGLVRGRCGTPGYVAPEIFTAATGVGYGNNVDVFSAGVTLYVLLCGYEPFFAETEAKLIEANKKAEIRFTGDEWAAVSDEAKDLILSMTKPNPSARPSAAQALAHSWIGKYCSDCGSDSVKNASSHGSIVDSASSTTPDDGACCVM